MFSMVLIGGLERPKVLLEGIGAGNRFRTSRSARLVFVGRCFALDLPGGG